MRGIALLFFMTLLLGAKPAQAKKVALVLGNQQYTNIAQLNNPESDARDVAQALRSLEFELIGKNSAGDGGPVLNEDLLGMTEALTRFGREAADADLALVFYAGHGATIDNESYLLPVNAISPLEGDSLSEARLQVLKSSSLALKQVVAYLDGVKGGKIAVFDACREVLNLKQRNLLGISGNTNTGILRGGLIPPSGSANQLLVAFSGASGQLVQDGTGRNSPYTKVLLEELRQPKQRDIVAFFTDVAAESGQRLSASGNAQTPVVELRSLRSGRYYLADAAAAPRPDEPAVPDQRDLIREIQKELTRLGYSLGEADGQTGHRTTASIKAFERSHGLSVTGAATEALLEHLVVAKGSVGPEKSREPVAGEKWSNSLGMEFVTIPAGKFRMGDLSGKGGDDEKPVHEVQIRQPFAMMTTEVTVGQFRRFVEDTGYRTEAERNVAMQGCWVWTRENQAAWREGYSWRSPGFDQTDRHPVVCVSWNDAQQMIGWLNGKGEGVYRLPSEAEWEYAARAGSTSDYAFGNDPSQLCQYGNGPDLTKHPKGNTWSNPANCRDGYWYTAPVGIFHANAFGLYDMHGNVWEWVEDNYHDSYSGHSGAESAWVSGDATRRVLRGGSWGDSVPEYLRATTRSSDDASVRDSLVGFRLVQGR